MASLMVGVVAYDPKVVLIWEIIRDYAKEKKFDLDYVLFSNYETQVQALLNKKVDLAWNTNVAWIRTKKSAPFAEALLMRDTDINFTSMFIAHEDSNIHTLEDIKNKRIGFGSFDSAQAFILPAYYLKKEGLEPNRDYTMNRVDSDLGKHGDTGRSEYEILEKLKNKEYDAIALATSTWMRMIELGLAGSSLRPFYKSSGYSHCNFTNVTPNASYVNEFVEFMIGMDTKRSDITKMMEMEALSTWVKTGNDELNGYDELEKAMEWLNLF